MADDLSKSCRCCLGKPGMTLLFATILFQDSCWLSVASCVVSSVLILLFTLNLAEKIIIQTYMLGWFFTLLHQLISHFITHNHAREWNPLEFCTFQKPFELFFFMARQPLVGQGLLIVEASRSHSGTPHSVVLLCTGDQHHAKTSTWQHRTLTRGRQRCPSGVRTRNPCKRAAADPNALGRAPTGIGFQL